jgi:site-specific DNA-methyltransferase (adenine-specific)
MYGRDFAECEYAWVRSGGTRIFKKSPNQLDRFHPTQKPVALYDWIFNKYATPGMKILDTHLGSGSSRIAAYKAKLDFTGYEIDPEYFEAQEKRFQIFIAQGTLF